MDEKDLITIEHALLAARQAVAGFTPGEIESVLKTGGDPLTGADLAVNDVLRSILPQPGEGWLSEETADDPARLDCRRVWVVDPIDGTREFIQGIPEWCISVGLVEDGQAVAGGILNPTTDQLIVGGEGHGVTLNGRPVAMGSTPDLRGALVLASRSEVKRGEWDAFFKEPISIRNVGSVAYKLGLVAAGVADATWTLVPKHEWDVAAGAALVRAGGGVIMNPDGTPAVFNQPDPKLTGFVAVGRGLAAQTMELIRRVQGES
ncbi:MAG: 3'(2'),5'-bisphosphate nucleotidase CysQ [Acidimicrobiia bacterium]|jgi:myo-inositol-1(or 4)-monophosphatase|nr:3'(2'),5'-bisphosphate nucleotidase CysQ [Acidimicrobiia bacterium]